MDKYKKYVKPYLSAFILGPIFMIVEVLGEVILPKLMSIIINYGCGQGGYESRGIGFITLIGGSHDPDSGLYDGWWSAGGLFRSKGIGKFCGRSA